MEVYTFKLIDSKSIGKFKSKELQAYLSQHKEIKEDFAKIAAGNNRWEYWVGEGKKPLCLLIRRALKREEEEKLSPWLEEEIECYWIDFVPLSDSSFPHLVEQFLELSDNHSPAFFTDPEVTEEEKIALFEQIGFKRVGSLIKGQGFFKGTSHYVMKRLR